MLSTRVAAPAPAPVPATRRPPRPCRPNRLIAVSRSPLCSMLVRFQRAIARFRPAQISRRRREREGVRPPARPLAHSDGRARRRAAGSRRHRFGWEGERALIRRAQAGQPAGRGKGDRPGRSLIHLRVGATFHTCRFLATRRASCATRARSPAHSRLGDIRRAVGEPGALVRASVCLCAHL